MKKVLFVALVILVGCSKKDDSEPKNNYRCSVAEYINGRMVDGTDSNFTFTGTPDQMNALVMSLSDTLTSGGNVNGKRAGCMKTF